MHEHGEVEDAEDEVSFPFDVYKGRGNEIAQSKIKCPVGRRCECYCFAAHPEGIQFWGVDPGYWAPRWSVRSDEEIGAGDDGFRWWTTHTPARFWGVPSYAPGTGVVAVGFEETGICEHPGHHSDGAEEKGGAATPAVDVEEGRDGHNDVDYVLDGGGDKEVVPGEASHSEDVGYVIHYENLVDGGRCVHS